MRRHEVTEELIDDAAARALELGWVKRGDRVGITAGLPSGRPGTTSLFQIQTRADRGPVARVAASRSRIARGTSRPATSAADPHRDQHGERGDRLGRAEVDEVAAERHAGERARRAADRGRSGERRAARTRVSPAA